MSKVNLTSGFYDFGFISVDHNPTGGEIITIKLKKFGEDESSITIDFDESGTRLVWFDPEVSELVKSIGNKDTRIAWKHE